jgi:hypothetical protein
MTNAARDAGFVARKIHVVVAIDRLLARLLEAAPEQWVVKGGYANQLRRPDDARFTEDLDLKIDAAIEMAPELLASGFAVDLSDDFSYEVASSPVPLEGPPGGGLRFVVVARLAGTELVRFKVDVSAADVVVGDFESYFSDPIVERLGFPRSRFPVRRAPARSRDPIGKSLTSTEDRIEPVDRACLRPIAARARRRSAASPPEQTVVPDRLE